MRTAALVLLACALAGCGRRPIPPPEIVKEIVTVEVKVPVAVVRVPPPELLAPIQGPRPVFVDPSAPGASSALTVEGERLLRAWLEELRQRIEAWKTWAQTPETP